MTVEELFDNATKAIAAGKFDDASKGADNIIAASTEVDSLAAAWFLKGLANEHLGNVQDAVSAYSEAVKIDPTLDKAWYRLSNLLIATAQFAAGLTAIKKAIELDPTLALDADALALLSRALTETGDPKGALKALEDAAKSNPQILENGYLQLQEGLAQNSLGESKKALTALDKACRLITDNPPVLEMVFLQQGLAQQALKQHDEAIKLFDKALELNTQASVRSLLWLHKARSYVALNDQATAAEALDNAQEASASIPNPSELGGVQLQLGLAWQGLGEPAKALEALRKAETLIEDPVQLGLVMVRQGLAQRDLGQHELALAAFDKALALLPQGQRGFVWLYKADSDLALNDEAAAKEALNSAGKETLPDADFFLRKAGLLILLGRPEEALSDLEQVINLDPVSFVAWNQKAGLLAQLGRYLPALDAVEKAMELTADGPERTLLRLGKARLLVKLSDFKKAQTTLDETSAIDPTTAENLKFFEIKAEVLLGLGKPDAIDDLFRTAAQNPKLEGNPGFQSLWANALILIGKNQEAMAKFESIAEHKPTDGNAESWLAYGGALSILVRFGPALEALEQARLLDPTVEANPQYLTTQMLSLSGTGRHEDALKAAGALSALDPSSPVPHIYGGIALAGLEKYQEALKEIDNAIKLSQGSVVAKLYESVSLIQKGWVLLAMKQSDEALVAFNKGTELADEARNVPNRVAGLLGQGLALYSHSKTEPAEQAEVSKSEAFRVTNQAVELSKALPDGPIPALAWWSKGNLLSWLERPEEALLAYQRADECQPNLTRILLSLGDAFERLQDHERAVEAFSAAAKNAEGVEQKSEAWFGKGRNLRLLERYEETIEACRNAIAAAGESEKILELLGRAYSALGRNEAAFQTYRRGWALGRPTHRSAACALGVSAALLAQNRNVESQTFLEKAEKETTFSGELYYNYGVTLYRLKSFGPAARALRKAAKMGVPGADEYADKLEGGGSPNRTWIDFWFGNAAWMRKPLGTLLVVLLVIALLPSFLKIDALPFLPWLDLSKDWKIMLIPIIVVASLLLLPILKHVSVKGMEFDLSQPEPQVGRPDLDTALKAFLEANPATALIPGTRDAQPHA